MPAADLRSGQDKDWVEHPDTATSLNDLAELYEATGDYAKAEPLYQNALAIWQKVLGPEHPNTATSLENLAVLEFDLGRNKEAEALARRAADAQRNLLLRMFSFSSEPQRLAYFVTFNPYTVFALLPGCEPELAVTLLRYKGIVLDSVIEDRLIAQSSTNAEDRNRVERFNSARRQPAAGYPAGKRAAATALRTVALAEPLSNRWSSDQSGPAGGPLTVNTALGHPRLL